MANNGNLTPWVAGQSGNLNGRPVGSRTVFSQGRPRMGRVVPDKDHQGMLRSVKSSGLSDMSNLCWSKDNVMAQAIREVARDAANDPQKCPVKRGAGDQKSPPIRLNAA